MIVRQGSLTLADDERELKPACLDSDVPEISAFHRNTQKWVGRVCSSCGGSTVIVEESFSLLRGGIHRRVLPEFDGLHITAALSLLNDDAQQQ